MPEADRIQCERCGREDAPALQAPPFRDELGERIRREICRSCWEEWKQRQMLLINHYGLNVQDAAAREFLLTNLRSFLFREGPDGAPIDTSMEGDVSW
jgi:Fe-S cluster biosynthesis and repair protein YggX